jgi:hypothetical protein
VDLTFQTSPADQQAHEHTVVSSSSDESSRSWIVYKAASPSQKVCVGVTGRDLGTLLKPVRRFDGAVFGSMTAAVRESGPSLSQVRTALKTGRSTKQGFSFTKERADQGS